MSATLADDDQARPRRAADGMTIDVAAAEAAASPLATAVEGGDDRTPTSEDGSDHIESDEDLDDDDDDHGAYHAPMSPTAPLDDDIDFSLVYALHTFVATMEGQVAVVRNEPLILLDDSNSYWWLVKPLRSNTIGYIPAEIVETPYERLARVNRQKNIERAQPHAHDIPGAPSKSTRPSDNPKTVQFPLDPRGGYYEYSPAVSEADSDEEDDEFLMGHDVDEDGSVHSEEDAAMHEADKPASDTGSADHDDDDDEDEAEKARHRTSIGAGLLLRNRDDFEAEEDEVAPEIAHEKPAESEVGSGVSAAEDSTVLSFANDAAAPAAEPPVTPETTTPAISVTPAATSPIPSSVAPSTGGASSQELDAITVLRIFPGQCSIPADVAQFKTVVVTKTMTVRELVRQAVLKYRVIGPLAAVPNQPLADDDWFLTISFTTAAHPNHHELQSDQVVLEALAAYQQQAELEARTSTSSPTLAPANKKPTGARRVLARFASKLYTPTLLASTRPSSHHIPKPILQVISPQDSTSIKLMLHQRSVVAAGGVAPAAPAAAAPAAPLTGDQLIRVVLHGEPTTADAAASGDTVRMAKILKVRCADTVAEVMRSALLKFARSEGRALGSIEEYDLVVDGIPGALPLDQHAPLPPIAAARTYPTYLLIPRPAPAIPVPSPAVVSATTTIKRTSIDRPVRASSLLVDTQQRGLAVSPAVAPALTVVTATASSSAPPAAAAPSAPAPLDSLAPPSVGSASGKRFSELLSEAQSLDLMHLFDENASQS
ncbi:hypothetical protein AMAG_01996 [Allomyces macrogynus ATCC 38327]|uniref:SH3 domain-containing protein n=1 Tax=Allomyces macrogynus (strain ATCC 38327) TaxID=578462 RepID=A0A0L0S198_ALLM3|nr:hypothetical protein AMAG_01996 [Allomyces macrogynus ATCC 38327]|eukprot:KNE56161.1 hypothetical protein AMAG_01996 [Allomyces macrogynus ATCC 38327]